MKELIAALCLALSLCTGGADNTGYIFVGDSRTVGMNSAVGIEDDDCFVVAEVGKGYDWFMKEGFLEVCRIVEDHPEYDSWVLISNLGVNDLYNADKYTVLYEELSDLIDVYVVSVNPCKGGYAKLNKDIETFNSTVQSIDGITYIDTYTVLKDNGFRSADGLHYSKDTYNMIYDTIMENLK